MPSLAIDQIKTGTRHRRDLGDIDALSQSMVEVGLLHPVVVTPDNNLVAGMRRIAAAKRLGWTSISVCVAKTLDDARKLLIAERDENTCRKDFAPSEAVALGKELEEFEKPKAEERKREHGKTAPGKPKNTGGKLPPVLNAEKNNDSGKTRDKVAEAVGMSGRTYEKAKAVVKAAESDPEKFGDLAQKMDDSGKVNAAFKELQKRQQEPAKSEEDISEEEEKATPTVLDENENPVPEQAIPAFNQLPELKDLVKTLDGAAKEVERLGKSPVGLHMHWQSAQTQIKGARQTIRQGRPAFVCPYCNGKQADCSACKGQGWVTVATYDQRPESLEEKGRKK